MFATQVNGYDLAECTHFFVSASTTVIVGGRTRLNQTSALKCAKDICFYRVNKKLLVDIRVVIIKMQVLFALTNGVFRVLLARKPVIVPAKVDYLKQNMPLMRADNILEILFNYGT